MSIDVYVDINIPVNYELNDAMTFAFGFYSFKSSFDEILEYIETHLSLLYWSLFRTSPLQESEIKDPYVKMFVL